jgi:AraC family transcriptional regulator of adaptative response/methylated-DNA-[protein]-cysteine methyltransferase
MKKMMYSTLIDSPLGPLLACTDDQGICLLEFENHAPKKRAWIENYHEGSHPFLDQLSQELTEYFAGKRQIFSVPLHPMGTLFQLSVWQTLQQIPFGQTWSYQQQAEHMKQPLAIRAIASANGCNPLSIMIPCHRVIGKNGKLTGYAGGLEKKQWLLEFETRNHTIMQDLE